MSTGTFMRTRKELEQAGRLCVQRGQRSQPCEYRFGPDVLILAESLAPKPADSGAHTHSEGAGPVEKCSTPWVEQGETALLQNPPILEQGETGLAPKPADSGASNTALEQAQLLETVAESERFAKKLEQGASIDRYIDSDGSIDAKKRYAQNADAAQAALERVVSISAGRKYAAEEIQGMRTAMMGYTAANPPQSGQMPLSPPDDTICRQVLSVADIGVIREALLELHREKRPSGDKWGWYVTVLMQRIWGVKPQALKARREQERRRKAQQAAQQAQAARPAEPAKAAASASYVGGGVDPELMEYVKQARAGR